MITRIKVSVSFYPDVKEFSASNFSRIYICTFLDAPAECTKFNEVNDVLEKLQAHVDSVNCEIKNAKETIEEQKKLCRNASPSRRQNCGGGGGGGYSNMSRNCGHQSSSCNDNSFVSQIFEMFSILWNGDADMCTCSGGINDGSNTLTDERKYTYYTSFINIKQFLIKKCPG